MTDDIHQLQEMVSQKNREISELKEDNLRLRNAQEVGGNMYGHKLNEVSVLHKQIESPTDRDWETISCNWCMSSVIF